MALANALVRSALTAMAAPASEVPFEEQLAQVAAEAEFKRLHSFDHGEALAKELTEAWAEHKDKAMEHAKKGLMDDGCGDYSFEIFSRLGATERDVYKHMPEELRKMKERNKMWVLRPNAESCTYIFRIKYTGEAKQILERLEKEQEHLAKKHLEHAAKKQRSDTEATAVAHNKAADAYYEAKRMYNENQNITNATAVIQTYEKLNNTRFDKLAVVAANYTEDPTYYHALAVNAAYDEALTTANAASLPKAMQLRTDCNDGFVIPKNLLDREVLFHPTLESNPTWAKVTAQDSNNGILVLTTHLGDKVIKRAQVIDVRRNTEDSVEMLEEREHEAAPVAPPALYRQRSVVM